jgi:hypothetical protein
VSESTGSALARALAKAQAVMEGASKDKTNPAFKSRYADLASVWDACRGPLTSNGLAVVQLVTSADKTSVTVETRLLHEGGESLSSTLTLPVEKATAQGVGSAITYARRYGLSAMVGVAPDDDDDGNGASKPARPYTQPQVSAPPSPPSNVRPLTQSHEAAIAEWAAKFASCATLAELDAAGRELAKSSNVALKTACRTSYDMRRSALARAS